MTDATFGFLCGDGESLWVGSSSSVVGITVGVFFNEFVDPFLKGGAGSLDVFLTGCLHGEEYDEDCGMVS